MTDPQRAFLRGSLASAPFLIIVVPFGILFGVVASDAGLTMLQTMAFSILVIAGAAQFAAVQLLVDHAPTVIIVATALAINLRMAMYSAALSPHLGAAKPWQRVLMSYFLIDQSFVTAAGEFARRSDQGLSQKVGFFMGAAAPVCPFWYASTYVGARFGAAIPPEYALDFAVPIAFLATTAPMLRTWAHAAAASVSVVLALAFVALPYSAGLLVAAVGAMIAGAAVEVWTEGTRR